MKTENNFHDATLNIYNSLGEQVKEINKINGQTITLMREDLPAGVYFVQITESNKVISSAKLMIAN